MPGQVERDAVGDAEGRGHRDVRRGPEARGVRRPPGHPGPPRAARDPGRSGLLAHRAVEVGQLAIVAVFVPLIWLLRKQRWYARWVLGGGSALIALLALAWLVERLFDLKFLPV